MTVTPTRLRLLEEGDFPAVAALARGSGRSVTPGALRRLLARDKEGAFVLEHGGALVGAVTATTYLDRGALGELLVRADVQGGGFDLLLARHALASLMRRGVRSIDAEVPERLRALYAALGFAPLRETVVLAGRTLVAAPRAGDVREARLSDFLDVGELDAATYGYGRKGLLLDLMEETPGGAFVSYSGDALEGFLFTARGASGWRLGPWVVAEGAEDAAAGLLDAALTALPEGEVTAQVPRSAKRAIALLEARGFAPREARVTMRWGGAPGVPNAAGEYAVAAGPVL